MSKTKNGRQNNFFSIFLLYINAQFSVSASFGVDKLICHVLDKNDLYLTFKFRMVTANTQIKTFFCI